LYALFLRHGHPGQQAADRRDQSVAENPEREQRKPDQPHQQRECEIQDPHEDPEHRPQDRFDHQGGRDQRNDYCVFHAGAVTVFHPGNSDRHARRYQAATIGRFLKLAL
jgi:hypothetical protein